MINVTWNGKPLTKDSIEEMLVQEVVEHYRELLGAIRLPETGEFPTIAVTGRNFSDLKLHIEGSPALLELVSQRLEAHDVSDDDAFGGCTSAITTQDEAERPVVFLSHASEDAALARRIAETLTKSGIDTWFDGWCITAGDSIRQRIDEGLGGCTHFVVLLTPQSVTKPWVKAEMDAGLIRKLSTGGRFIALRCGLSVSELPPLLQGLHSPEVTPDDLDWQQLVNDIHGVTRKPPLGTVPSVIVQGSTSSGFSPAATAVAKLFVETSVHALQHDPSFNTSELASTLGLSDEDLEDAIYELKGYVSVVFDRVYVEEALFAKFDGLWMPWNPERDALKIAMGIVNDSDFPDSSEEIAMLMDWPARRLNPAMTFLSQRRLVEQTRFYGQGNWVSHRITKTPALRRFVKDRV